MVCHPVILYKNIQVNQSHPSTSQYPYKFLLQYMLLGIDTFLIGVSTNYNIIITTDLLVIVIHEVELKHF